MTIVYVLALGCPLLCLVASVLTYARPLTPSIINAQVPPYTQEPVHAMYVLTSAFNCLLITACCYYCTLQPNTATFMHLLVLTGLNSIMGFIFYTIICAAVVGGIDATFYYVLWFLYQFYLVFATLQFRYYTTNMGYPLLTATAKNISMIHDFFKLIPQTLMSLALYFVIYTFC